jgi:hypothetical protein
VAKFAIIRQDGEIDTAEGTSVEDIIGRYGSPGNGDIVPYDPAQHSENVRHSFKSPEDQAAAWSGIQAAESAAVAQAAADREAQFEARVARAVSAALAPVEAPSAGSTVNEGDA